MIDQRLFIVCILFRLAIAYGIKKYQHYHKYISFLLLLPAIGFLTIYFTRSRNTGAFGQPAWWNSLRPIHGILYLCAAIMLYQRNKNAYLPLILDVLIGTIAIIYMYIS